MKIEELHGIEIHKIDSAPQWFAAVVHGWSLCWQATESVHEFKQFVESHLADHQYLVIENTDVRQLVEAVEFMRRNFAYYPIGGISAVNHNPKIGTQLFYMQAIAKRD